MFSACFKEEFAMSFITKSIQHTCLLLAFMVMFLISPSKYFVIFLLLGSRYGSTVPLYQFSLTRCLVIRLSGDAQKHLTRPASLARPSIGFNNRTKESSSE